MSLESAEREFTFAIGLVDENDPASLEWLATCATALADYRRSEPLKVNSIPERAENRPCANCKKPIQPGQLYITKAPYHIRCAPKED